MLKQVNVVSRIGNAEVGKTTGLTCKTTGIRSTIYKQNLESFKPCSVRNNQFAEESVVLKLLIEIALSKLEAIRASRKFKPCST